MFEWHYNCWKRPQELGLLGILPAFLPILQMCRQAKDRQASELRLQVQIPGSGAASSSSSAAVAGFVSHTPAGAQMQLSSGWRHLAELQMLVLGDVELEFVLLKELAELLDIALVKPVHFLL